MWIESVLGNLLWPCSLIETSDTELSGIHWSRKVPYLKSRVSHWSAEKQKRWRDMTWRMAYGNSPPWSKDGPAPPGQHNFCRTHKHANLSRRNYWAVHARIGRFSHSRQLPTTLSTLPWTPNWTPPFGAKGQGQPSSWEGSPWLVRSREWNVELVGADVGGEREAMCSADWWRCATTTDILQCVNKRIF